jgi:hypothetical protein
LMTTNPTKITRNKINKTRIDKNRITT